MVQKAHQKAGVTPAKKARATTKRADSGADSPLMVNSVQKAFRVLTAFNHAEPRMTLTQIVDKLGIDKSTAQRFTHTLNVMGYLDKDPVTKTMGVTVKVLDLANTYLSSNPLIAAAMPYLVHLNGQTGETVNLTVIDGTDVVFISRIVGSHLLSTGVLIGTRLPAYATAAGLAMMSVMSDAQIAQMIAASDLQPFTPKTVHEPAKLVERLKGIQSKGYALSVADYFVNDISLGAPIVSRAGQVLGGVSLAVSIDRYSPKEAETKFAKLVSSAAKSVVI